MKLSPTEIVFYRTAIAVILLAIWLLLLKKLKWLGKKSYIILASGILTFLYWSMIVLSTHLANEAVCLIGLATTPLFISVFKPFFSGKAISIGEIITGLNAIFGIYIIHSSDFNYGLGFSVALLAAVFGAVLTILNSQLVQEQDPLVITFYQMSGACLTALSLLFWSSLTGMLEGFISFSSDISPKDFLLLALLAFALSIYAYSESVRLMRFLKPFTVAMVNNFAPIYGIATTILIYWLIGEPFTSMDIYFYAGAFILFSAVVGRPLVEWFFEKNFLKLGQNIESSDTNED